jgi:hypothetical protein
MSAIATLIARVMAVTSQPGALHVNLEAKEALRELAGRAEAELVERDMPRAVFVEDRNAPLPVVADVEEHDQ